ncbi:pleckstrin homology domain-containing family F member 2-like isoform X2 [Amphibalanus amphitrite]|uniref:pleckstrin homology domain-containing family F member 2-like isoform X2 n=1 Tax=Amphibalanus amphitrite TaxID=1232801 RepID=UPI001C90E2D4|nr:pleckstrin homology domain-containing family F member 2-like isoform X2 [Amphibalanus amphitrite]
MRRAAAGRKPTTRPGIGTDGRTARAGRTAVTAVGRVSAVQVVRAPGTSNMTVNSEANTRRIAIVEQCFGSSGQPLAVQGRVLVGEGVLTKMCRKKPKPRQFFLCNDILIYGNIVISKKKYNCQRIIPLEEVKLESLEDDAQYKNGWLVRTRTKSFAVYAATAAEKAEWMAHINKCVDDLLKKSGKLGATDHAAVWVPDTEAGSCMHCKKSQFTIINRRHHCRKCGKVVCGPCSNKKWILPSQSSKPLRVCLTCYDELSRAKADDNRLAGDTRDGCDRPPPHLAPRPVPPPASEHRRRPTPLAQVSLWWDSFGETTRSVPPPANAGAGGRDCGVWGV